MNKELIVWNVVLIQIESRRSSGIYDLLCILMVDAQYRISVRPTIKTIQRKIYLWFTSMNERGADRDAWFDPNLGNDSRKKVYGSHWMESQSSLAAVQKWWWLFLAHGYKLVRGRREIGREFRRLECGDRLHIRRCSLGAKGDISYMCMYRSYLEMKQSLRRSS